MSYIKKLILLCFITIKVHSLPIKAMFLQHKDKTGPIICCFYDIYGIGTEKQNIQVLNEYKNNIEVIAKEQQIMILGGCEEDVNTEIQKIFALKQELVENHYERYPDMDMYNAQKLIISNLYDFIFRIPQYTPQIHRVATKRTVLATWCFLMDVLSVFETQKANGDQNLDFIAKELNSIPLCNQKIGSLVAYFEQHFEALTKLIKKEKNTLIKKICSRKQLELKNILEGSKTIPKDILSMPLKDYIHTINQLQRKQELDIHEYVKEIKLPEDISEQNFRATFKPIITLCDTEPLANLFEIQLLLKISQAQNQNKVIIFAGAQHCENIVSELLRSKEYTILYQSKIKTKKGEFYPYPEALKAFETITTQTPQTDLLSFFEPMDPDIFQLLTLDASDFNTQGKRI